jgi:hypothetical protein
MKISLPFIVIFTLLSSHVSATFNVDWNSSGAMLDQTTAPGSPVPIGGFPLGQPVLYALYFSPDASISMSPTSGGGVYNWDGSVAAQRNNDVLVSVAEDDWDFAGRTLAVSSDYQGNDILTGNSTGYFYSVVFEYDDPAVLEANSATWAFSVPNGTYGYITAPVLVTNNAALPSTTVNVNSGGTWDGSSGVAAGSAIANTLFAIPEPSSVMLIGAAAIFLLNMRRRFRK